MAWPTLTTIISALVPLTVVAVDIVRRIQQRIERKGYPLPPGPTPLPLLGSALSVNSQVPWLTYTEWRATYGDIMYIRVLDTDVIVLNSTDIAMDLLEKRSRIYSDRPFIPTLAPYGCDCNFAFLPYGEHWRLCRRIFQQTFRANAAVVFRPMQLQRARQLVKNLLDDPNEYPFHFATFTSAVSMSAVYDYEPHPRNDPMVSMIDNYLQVAIPGIAPGKIYLIKLFPFLLHVPRWLPGSWISREVKEACELKNKTVETPYKYVQKRMESNDHINVTMVSDHITRMQKLSGSDRSAYEIALKHASVTAFIGSTETTSSGLMTFTFLMVENPRVWKRAQAEIDAVVGIGRLPEFDDRPSLPYVEAVLRETLRWRPIVPTLIPHAAARSDIYNGYYIPKGATILVNVWGISRDEARYPDPDRFIPERFLNAEGKLVEDDPAKYIFGFGRRKCPGQYTADASLWCAMATMLATLEFHHAKGADGNDITIKPTFTNGITDHPNPFPCQITPRTHINNEVIGRILAK